MSSGKRGAAASKSSARPSAGAAHEGGAHEALEWGGVGGAVAIMAGLPSLIVVLGAVCGPAGCPAAPAGWDGTPAGAVAVLQGFWSWEAMGVVLSWMLLHAFLHIVVPGRTELGQELADGTRLPYRLNGFWCGVISVLVVGGLHVSGAARLTWVADHLNELAGAALVFTIAMSAALYAAARINPVGLAPHGNTGHATYDFFVGHQLNPRWMGFDFKFFVELRPGLVGWALINLALALKQLELHGQLSNSMILVNIFEAIYVFDALWFEKCILTTMDITTEGFGFMLCVGSLAFLPFTYSLQARYLAYFPVHLPLPALIGVLAVTLLGGYIFRASNWQKNAFREDPTAPRVAHLKYIQTERGTKLLVSGWWGMSRHMNYLGDWLMGTGWCLPCAFGSPIPYFYSIYFAGLLIHRSLRDEEKCAKKYGADWVKYCKAVPYRIVPYVY